MFSFTISERVSSRRTSRTPSICRLSTAAANSASTSCQNTTAWVVNRAVKLSSRRCWLIGVFFLLFQTGRFYRTLLCNEFVTLYREPILLQPTIGFVWQRHFDHCKCQQAFYLFVQFTRNRFMPQRLCQLGFACCTFAEQEHHFS